MNAQTKVEAARLSSAMAEAFKEIEGATKSANNPHFKSKYADLSAVVDAIKPALINHGLFFTQRCQPSAEGVTIDTVLHHSSGEEMPLGSLFVPANRRDAQGFGSALTYARRYALMTAFGVPAEDDDGNAAVASTAQRPARNPVNGNGKDAPFPPGPAKNKTDLKEKGRAFWRDVEACDDADQLAALLTSHKELTNQIAKALPAWWEGGKAENGEPFDGLSVVISRKQTGLDANADWRGNPLNGG
ncbi:ERF family protein [Allosphingosinicella flava]|uniref:ERF family protein n=1 Tax=Allosphingosinicella flava TaxID=2771430 RepID=A0A7T2GKJ4_9SPHN|nr:ERF family protein [Sphingosinicella flava]QPQ55561.1 ERF family protein [Sphingosinicella flava]